jgi:hypothetical protein
MIKDSKMFIQEEEFGLNLLEYVTDSSQSQQFNMPKMIERANHYRFINSRIRSYLAQDFSL